jgi:hypothetical protein
MSDRTEAFNGRYFLIGGIPGGRGGRVGELWKVGFLILRTSNLHGKKGVPTVLERLTSRNNPIYVILLGLPLLLTNACERNLTLGA